MMFTNFTSARRAGWKRLRAASSEGQAVGLTDIRSITTPPATFTRAQSDTYVSPASLPGFLRLPPESRNVIYDLTLPDREYLSPLPPALRYKTQSSLAAAYGLDNSYASLAPLCHSAVPHPLLQTCRTFRSEAYPMYFGRNLFVLDFNEFEDVEFGGLLGVCRLVKALLRPTTATRYSHTNKWLRAANAHAICCMRNVLIVDRVACVLRKHEILAKGNMNHFAAMVDLFPVEGAVQIHLQWQSERRMIRVTNQVSMVLEEFVQLKLTANMSVTRQKKELIATAESELAYRLTMLIVVSLLLFGLSVAFRHKAKQAHLLSTVLAELNLTVAAVNGVVGFETSKMQNQLHGWETSH
ncbi:hypothetical protein LTR17_017293 [Elasticomyces elasticus]|nr:hypothetical protein LTR17_017293 [Elasticomyces elasticus]